MTWDENRATSSNGKKTGPLPINVCIALSIITSLSNIMSIWKILKEKGCTIEDVADMALGTKKLPDDVNEPAFFRKGISFSESPTLWKISSNVTTLHGMISEFLTQPIGYSTNFIRVFQLLLDMENDFTEETRVKRVIAFTDMQMNMTPGSSDTTLVQIFDMYRNKFGSDPNWMSKMPELIYWDVSNRPEYHTTDIESTGELGVAKINGYSPTLLQVILYNEKPEGEVGEVQKEQEKITPLEIFKRVINHPSLIGITLPW